ncbi:hypothetical protein F7Q95_04180 [Pseudomonas psychrophila]|nr:hypothetical protein F7Q95_04180 [Pseudomonas psychrophila]
MQNWCRRYRRAQGNRHLRQRTKITLTEQGSPAGQPALWERACSRWSQCGGPDRPRRLNREQARSHSYAFPLELTTRCRIGAGDTDVLKGTGTYVSELK